MILRLYHCSYTMSMTFLRSVYPICTYITVGAYCVFLILESACNRLWTFPGSPVLLHILQKRSFAGSSVHMNILTIVILQTSGISGISPFCRLYRVSYTSTFVSICTSESQWKCFKTLRYHSTSQIYSSVAPTPLLLLCLIDNRTHLTKPSFCQLHPSLLMHYLHQIPNVSQSSLAKHLTH